jgi:hypothetical protein
MDKNHAEQHRIDLREEIIQILRTGSYQLWKGYCFSALMLYASLDTEHLNKKKQSQTYREQSRKP